MVSSRAITYPQRALVCGAGAPTIGQFPRPVFSPVRMAIPPLPDSCVAATAGACAGHPRSGRLDAVSVLSLRSGG